MPRHNSSVACPLTPAFLALAALLAISPAAGGAQSTCHGTVANGRLEGGVPLPPSGPNFASYSSLAEAVGRTHVHSTVRDIVIDAYQAMQVQSPGTTFVYGETGWRQGGRIKPHRTHQNGLSVDFMVPVRDRGGRSVALPTGPTNRFGYDYEFDQAGSAGELAIDFPAIADHLHQLDLAARRRGAGIALVIFDPAYLPRLFEAPAGRHLRSLDFMKGKPWVRHDEHYHVDFAIPCKPLR